MISSIYSAIPYGFDGRLVEVEGDSNRGLPAFNIVGMANKTVSEAKERVRSALVNSGFSFPDKKVVVNLAPAELRKDGTYLDLPIALVVLELSGQLLELDTRGKLFVGELSLDGQVRPIKGIINIVEAAKTAGIAEIFVPLDNLSQALSVPGVTVYGVGNLRDLYLHLKHQLTLKTSVDSQKMAVCGGSEPQVLLAHVRGQNVAKRALEIAVAGHHNILISGPPGAGKTLLAKAAVGLLPELTPEEMIEITKIYSIAGYSLDKVISERPFRSPHHTASAISIIGGGATASPGEISLAHKGVLFLDEAPEFPRAVLESLRQPLEDKKIAVSRANTKTTYPADFMLIATMNPCPCGYLGDPTHECKCSEIQIQSYQKRISGPLLDRIDIKINVGRVGNDELLVPTDSVDTQSVVKNTITGAMERQKARYGRGGVYNSSLSSFEVSKLLQLSSPAKALLARASDRLGLSARAYFKIIKVAQTIADLEGADKISDSHVAEAIGYAR